MATGESYPIVCLRCPPGVGSAGQLEGAEYEVACPWRTTEGLGHTTAAELPGGRTAAHTGTHRWNHYAKVRGTGKILYASLGCCEMKFENIFSKV